MKTIKFKTNINCIGCLTKVTPFIEKEGITDLWEVSLSSPDKILTMDSDKNNSMQLMNAVTKAGYKIEQIN